MISDRTMIIVSAIFAVALIVVAGLILLASLIETGHL